MRSTFQDLVIANPKRHFDARLRDERLFPYYAGYSPTFTLQLLSSAKLTLGSFGLDPWSGAGTTVQALQNLGCSGLGIDLNPVMVIVAKASLLSPREAPSLVPLGRSIVDRARRIEEDSIESDPLTEWLYEENASWIRKIEAVVNQTLVSHSQYAALASTQTLTRVSPLAAFFYVSLFRAVRRLLVAFVPTNPTWVKVPALSQSRKRPSREAVNEAFMHEVRKLSASLGKSQSSKDECDVDVSLGSSEQIAVESSSVDFILGSPPYCTRIDYAVATAIELAILRFDKRSFDLLRRSLMGTSTVPPNDLKYCPEWGRTCIRFLSRLYGHSSKASRTYYFKNHIQYFNSLHISIRELSRVLKRHGACVLVVQDSHYKDLRNDVPQVTEEMALHYGLVLRRRENFISNKSMVYMNQRASKYLTTRTTVESVLCFEKR